MSLADVLDSAGLKAPPDQPQVDYSAMGGGLAMPIGGQGAPPASPSAANGPLIQSLPDQSADNAALQQQVGQGSQDRAHAKYAELARQYGIAPQGAPAVAPPPAGPAGPPAGVGAYGGGNGQPPGVDPDVLAAGRYNAGGPARPAGFVPKSLSAESSPVRPEAEQAVGDLEQSRIEQAKAQQQYNMAAGEAMAPLQKRQLQEQQALQANIHSSLAEHVQKIQDLTETADKAANEAPASFWGDNTGQKITRTIGMALMAFGHGLNPNAANPMEFMNAMIKENAEKQRAKVEGAKGSLAREQNLYAVMKDKFGDDQSALTATQMMQKQAVLDQIDQHFAPPAQKTWGGEEGHEDPFASLPPTARLGLANARVALAQDIAKDQLELDKAHVGKLTATQEYQQASGGQGRDPLAALKRESEAAKYKADIETAGPKAQADVRKEQAGAAAEEAKATAGGADQRKFEQAAKEIHSIGIWSNPAETISSRFQGTDGQEHRLAIDSYNAMVSAKFNETHRGLARSNKELFDRGLKTYEIHPDTDTPITIQRKLAQAREKLFNGAPASGGTPGAIQDTAGEGEDYE